MERKKGYDRFWTHSGAPKRMQRKMKQRRDIELYLFSQALLLCLIEAGKCIGSNSRILQILMYTAILINTIIVACHVRRTGAGRTKSSDQYVAFALLATAAADYFLTLIGNHAAFLPGVILFCCVQILYALYLGSTMKLLLLRIALFAVCLMFLNRAGMLTPVNAVGILDLNLLLINTIIAWTAASSKTPLLFRIGITLFLCCDLSVALANLATGSVRDVSDFLIWIFYIPSQAAITLSYLKAL